MKKQWTEELCVQRKKVVNTCEGRCHLKKMMDEEPTNKSTPKNQKAEEPAIDQAYPDFQFSTVFIAFVVENNSWACYSLAIWTDKYSGPPAPPPWLA
jgi:hypothetical protein